MATLQKGIYFDKSETPPRCFAILFLRANQGVTAQAVGELFLGLWQMYQGLQQGHVADLPGVEIPPSGLSVLVGFGPKAFALPFANPGEAGNPLPQALGLANQFRSSQPGGGNPILAGSKLRYATGLQRNVATEEIVVQFLGDTPLAVDRGVVETWKLLEDNQDPDTGQAALSITGVFTGFNREDARSWIDFHDGLSNMESGESRRLVIQVRPDTAGNAAWTVGGSYLAFLRLSVDLRAWRRLSRSEQERLVGRDKVTGCPLESTDAEGNPVPVGGCPAIGRDVLVKGNEQFREPPSGVTLSVQKSHIKRANQSTNFANPSSSRIFRQGYEFLERLDGDGNLLLGLNFVSFQDTPQRVITILSRPTWLRDVNFGGDTALDPPGAPELLHVHAAGIYLVPPVTDAEAFPGQSIFAPQPPM